MPINPVILFTDHIEAFENPFLYNIRQKDLLGKFNRCFTIGYLTIILSSDQSESLEVFEKYYNFDKTIRKNTSVLLIKITMGNNMSLNTEQFIWLQEKEGVMKGRDTFNSTVYQYDEVTMIKSYDNHYLKIHSNSIEDLVDNSSIITKVIEGIVIDQYLGLGYIPVHSSLVVNDNDSYLILGGSQSGKTTFAEELKNDNCTLISDEITFVGINDIVEYGHYIKKYVDGTNNKSKECFNGVIREVVKIKGKVQKVPKISKLFYMKISKDEAAIEEINDDEKKLKMLIEYLHMVPNEYFTSRQLSYPLLIEVAKKLAKAETSIVNNKWLTKIL